MRSFVMLTLGLLALGRVAHAQSAAGKGYVEGVAQSAFGNVTSQAYGAEGGFALTPGLWIFVEGGQIRDVATAAIGTAAQQIAASLTDLQPAAVAYRATRYEDVGRAMKRRPAEPPRDADIPPEVVAQLAGQFYEEHYRKWVDAPLTALGGRRAGDV